MRLFLPLTLLLLAGFVSSAPTGAQQDEPAELTYEELVERDGRLSFTPRTADLARAVLEREIAGPAERRAALFAVGGTGAVHLRHHLEDAAASEDVHLRRAALLALGEFGQRVGNADGILRAALEDPRVLGCALYALFRIDPRRAQRVARDLASRGGPGSFLAERIRDWDGVGAGPDCQAARIRLDLRWAAARRYGTIDGRSWNLVLLDELQANERFLDRFVLMEAAEIGGPLVRDHLVTMLVEDPRPVVVRACVRAMHAELDEMIGSGAWEPPDEAAWYALVDEAVSQGVGPYMPRAMLRASNFEGLQPLVVPFLARVDGDLLEQVLLDLEARQPQRRRMTVRGVGWAALVPAAQRLLAMAEDPSPLVRAEVWAVRCRLGDREARTYLRDTLVKPLPEDAPPQDLRERELIFQALIVHAAGRRVQELLVELVDRLDEEDPRLPYLLAVLRIEGQVVDDQPLLAALAARDELAGRDELLIRAAGRVPGSAALEHLADAFPHGGAASIDLALAHVLAEVSHPEVETLLGAAVWGQDWNRGVLAAAVVEENYGQNTLMLWAVQPPAGMGEGSLRRLGFAIGELGGLDAVDELTRRLGTGGADRPVLQGAILGALSARSH